MTTQPEIASKLTTAYNLVFDVKDALVGGSDENQAAFNALQSIEATMYLLGVDRVRRFDSPEKPK